MVDGEKVGIVGLIEGEITGTHVGSKEGELGLEGPTVGSTEGTYDGIAVGVVEGLRVGSIDETVEG
jgi:hypothetical protein